MQERFSRCIGLWKIRRCASDRVVPFGRKIAVRAARGALGNNEADLSELPECGRDLLETGGSRISTLALFSRFLEPMPLGRAVSSGRDFGPSGEPGNALIVGLLAGFVVVWTAYLSIGHAPFPILHDMSEAYVWGREFQLGYNQHPPFWAWVCGAWFLALPRAGWAFAALGALNAAIGLGGAWLLIGDFARGAKRWAAFALLLLTPFYTFGCLQIRRQHDLPFDLAVDDRIFSTRRCGIAGPARRSGSGSAWASP